MHYTIEVHVAVVEKHRYTVYATLSLRCEYWIMEHESWQPLENNEQQFGAQWGRWKFADDSVSSSIESSRLFHNVSIIS